jgi:hypothetical protein
MRTRTWSTLPKMMRMLPGRNAPSFFRVGNVSGTTNLSYRIWAARRQTPEEIAHKMMRMEDRGSKTQLTLSKRVESLTRNQPGRGRMRRGGYGDEKRRLWRREEEVMETRRGGYGDEKRRLWRREEEVMETRRGGYGDEKRRLWRREEEVMETRRGGYGDEKRRERGRAAAETDVPRNSKMLKNMLAAVKDGPTTACLRSSREKQARVIRARPRTAEARRRRCGE